jgi:hypothetical protein
VDASFLLDKLSRLVEQYMTTKPLSRLGRKNGMDKKELSRYLAKLGAKGGKTAAQRLTKEQRIERARKAGKASQAKAKRKGKP